MVKGQQISFMQVDVFTPRALGGNPLGVFFDGPENLDEETMRALAAEIGSFETVFVTKPPAGPGVYRTRVFSPRPSERTELPFSGHAALGTYYVLRKSGRLEGSGMQITPSGYSWFVQEAQEWVWMTPPSPRVCTVRVDPNMVARACGMAAEDAVMRQFMPPTLAYAGLGHLLVFVRTADALRRLRPSTPAVAALIRELRVHGVLAVAATGAESFDGRYFNPSLPEGEEAASGSAVAALGACLYSCAGQTDPRRYALRLGGSVNRPSEVGLRMNVLGRGSLEVGGQVAVVMDGVIPL